MLRRKTAKYYVLSSLIPYTKANLELTFKPSRFFAELERLDQIKQSAARNAFSRAIEKGLIILDDNDIPRLTDKGLREVQPFMAERLSNSKLMIIFDIPESERWKRTHLRSLLKELGFVQIQKSVWVSSYNHIQYLRAEIKNLHLENNVKIFECSEIAS